MAKFSMENLEALFDDLAAIIELPDEIALEMLTAGAEVLAEAQAAEAATMLAGEFSQGITAKSFVVDKKLSGKGGERCVYIKPDGTRTDGNKRRIAEVAFINEYGKTGQAARPFIRTANERKGEAAVDAAAQVYDKYLKSKNL